MLFDASAADRELNLANRGRRTIWIRDRTGTNNLVHVPEPLSAEQIAANPVQANATYDSRDERRYNRLARLGAVVEHRIDDRQSLSAMAYINPKFLQRSERGTFRDFTRYHGGANLAYNRLDTLSSTLANRVTVGLDQAYQDGAILFYSLSPTGGRGTTLNDNKKEGAYNSGPFVENELVVKDRLGLTVGAVTYTPLTLPTKRRV